MYSVILAAGLGTRMGDLTKNCPKPMLPIKDKPKLAYSIEALPEVITDVVLVVGYLSDQIKEYFGSEFKGRRIYYIEQKEFNGTAGAVMLVRDIVKGKFLVTMGDDLYYKKDLEELLKYDQSLLAYETDRAEQFGLVDIDNENYLTSVVERPHGQAIGLVNTGACVLSQKYFDVQMIPISDKEFGLPQTLVAMHPNQRTKVIKTKKWQSIGNSGDLEIARERISEFI